MEPTLLLFAEVSVFVSLRDSSSVMMLLSTTDGMVGKKRTPSFGDEHDGSATSSCTACWRMSRGLVHPTDDLPVWNF